VSGQPDAQQLPGPWLALATAANALEITSLNGTNNKVYGADLPWPSKPQARYTLFWSKDADLYVADLSGKIALFRLAKTEDIIHFRLIAARTNLPSAAAAPMLARAGHLLWIGANGTCLGLNTTNLDTVVRHKCASYVLDAVLVDDTLVISAGWPEPSLRGIRPETNQFRQTWSLRLNSLGPTLAKLDGNLVVTYDMLGNVLVFEPDSGNVLWSGTEPAPLSAAPAIVGSRWLTFTKDGAVYFRKCPFKELALR
jgi:outer membrane protein assembly factor BamB